VCPTTGLANRSDSLLMDIHQFLSIVQLLINIDESEYNLSIDILIDNPGRVRHEADTIAAHI
jgi:hypothetical protein